MGAIKLATSNSTDEEYGGTFPLDASDIPYDANTSVKQAIDDIANAGTTGGLVYWGTYPNGHSAGASGKALVTINAYKPKSSWTASNAYIYDSAGNYTDIKSQITAIDVVGNTIYININWNSNYAGKQLRIDLS